HRQTVRLDLLGRQGAHGDVVRRDGPGRDVGPLDAQHDDLTDAGGPRDDGGTVTRLEADVDSVSDVPGGHAALAAHDDRGAGGEDVPRMEPGSLVHRDLDLDLTELCRIIIARRVLAVPLSL